MVFTTISESLKRKYMFGHHSIQHEKPLLYYITSSVSGRFGERCVSRPYKSGSSAQFCRSVYSSEIQLKNDES